MTTKEEFVKTMHIVGFNHKVINSLLRNALQDEDLEDIMSLIATTPSITAKTLLKYVSEFHTLN